MASALIVINADYANYQRNCVPITNEKYVTEKIMKVYCKAMVVVVVEKLIKRLFLQKLEGFRVYFEIKTGNQGG